MIPEYLGNLKPIWDFLLKIGCWDYYSLRFNYKQLVVNKY